MEEKQTNKPCMDELSAGESDGDELQRSQRTQPACGVSLETEKSGAEAPPSDNAVSQCGSECPAENEEGRLRAALEEMRNDLEKAAAAQKQAEDRWLRGKAEVENVRRRAAKDVLGARALALESFAAAILEIRDALETAASHEPEIAVENRIVDGISMTLKKMDELFKKYQISEINPLGQPFDPQLHQAMMTKPATPDLQPNSVIEVIQKGYQIGDSLLRPAMVSVAQSKK